MTKSNQHNQKKLLLLAIIATTLSSNTWADSPPNISSNIPWTDTGGTENNASYAGINDIEAAFNNARRAEEIQLGLAVNTIADLILPASWDTMNDDAKALYLLNAERTSRTNMTAGVIGLPFAGIESNIDSIATDYAQLLHDTDTRGHHQPSQNDSGTNEDSPSRRIEQNSVIGSLHSSNISYHANTSPTHTDDNSTHYYADNHEGNAACHQFMARSENLAYFAAYSTGIPSVPLPLERSIYNWIYADAGSAWGHREAALLQDEVLDTNHNTDHWGFKNNKGSADHEGYIGIHSIGSADYEPFPPPAGWNNYGVAIVLNIFDPVSDDDANALACNYNITLRTEDLPTPNVEPVIQIASPAPNSTLAEADELLTFEGTHNGQVIIYLGSTDGDYDYYVGQFSKNSDTNTHLATSLPTDGSTIYVTIWYETDGVWTTYKTIYTAATITPAEIVTPAPYSTLTSSSQTFSINPNGINIQEAWLYVGSAQGNYNYYAGEIVDNSVFATSLPTDGSTIYLTLWYKTGNSWATSATTYTAATITVPVITSPEPESKLSGTSVESFTIAPNAINIQEAWLLIGSESGSYDYFAGEVQNNTITATNIPTDDSIIYVTLWYKSDGVWAKYETTYISPDGPSSI